jgi:hypothetical protein
MNLGFSQKYFYCNVAFQPRPSAYIEIDRERERTELVQDSAYRVGSKTWLLILVRGLKASIPGFSS